MDSKYLINCKLHNGRHSVNLQNDAGRPLTRALEDWVKMTDGGLGATSVLKIPDVAVADIGIAFTSSTEVVKLTVSSIG